MTPPRSPIVHDELACCLRRAPEKRDIAAIVSAMAPNDVRAAGKATAEVTWKLGLWLQRLASRSRRRSFIRWPTCCAAPVFQLRS